MREMKLGGTHDIMIKDGHIVRFAPDSANDFAKATAQAAQCMLKTEEGEAFTDARHGCPWFSQILGLPAVHLDIAKRIVKKKLQAVAGVEKVKGVNLECNGRNLSGSFTIQCSNGESSTGDF